MSIYLKCGGLSQPFYVKDASNENVTLADEKIMCSEHDKSMKSFFNIWRNKEKIPDIEVCIEDGTLQRISIVPDGSVAAKNCRKIKHIYVESILSLENMGIENFAKNWYRVENISYYSIDLSFNNITSITSNLLNDLPESIKHVSLSENKIERLDAGIIQNEFLMYLDLSNIGIREIQDNAWDQTNLTGLMLERNNFKDTRFVEKLPSGLKELYLYGNKISQISPNSFSRLNKLFLLDLRSNKIEILEKESLRGLTSLQMLILRENGLREIESEAFRDLGELRMLNLDINNMREFKKSVFSDLKELIMLYFNRNNLTKVTKDTLEGIPDNLRVLHLQNNSIDSLEEGSFVKVPKYRLDLSGNKIRKLNKGDINVPSLVDLYLNDNLITEIKEETFDLPNLESLELRRNLLENIERGAFRKLGNLELLEITGNPITTLRKGSLVGMKLQCKINVPFGNLELIQGGVFLDE